MNFLADFFIHKSYIWIRNFISDGDRCCFGCNNKRHGARHAFRINNLLCGYVNLLFIDIFIIHENFNKSKIITYKVTNSIL